METDVSMQDASSIIIITPLTEKAKDWFNEHIPDCATSWMGGPGVVVEHRYMQDIYDGMVDDGLVIKSNLQATNRIYGPF